MELRRSRTSEVAPAQPDSPQAAGLGRGGGGSVGCLVRLAGLRGLFKNKGSYSRCAVAQRDVSELGPT